jgi:hypothetical protein
MSWVRTTPFSKGYTVCTAFNDAVSTGCGQLRQENIRGREFRPALLALWSAAVRKRCQKKKHYKIQTLNESKIHPCMSVLKLPLSVDLQHKVGELFLSRTSCPTIVILENALNKCIEKMWL